MQLKEFPGFRISHSSFSASGALEMRAAVVPGLNLSVVSKHDDAESLLTFAEAEHRPPLPGNSARVDQGAGRRWNGGLVLPAVQMRRGLLHAFFTPWLCCGRRRQGEGEAGAISRLLSASMSPPRIIVDDILYDIQSEAGTTLGPSRVVKRVKDAGEVF